MFTIEKYPRQIPQRNQSSQNSMSVMIQSRKTSKLTKKGDTSMCKCKMQTHPSWMGVGEGRAVWEGEGFYLPFVTVCPSLFYEAFLLQFSITPFSYFNHEIYHTYRRGHKIYVCSIMKNCPVSPNVNPHPGQVIKPSRKPQSS